jgi:small GTP-binding protein
MRKYPVIYELNTWVWLNDLSQKNGCRIDLSNVPQFEIDRLAECSFDALWLMGVWQRSAESRKIAQTQVDLREAYQKALPDYTDEDIIGSPFAIHGYRVDERLGGDDGLAKFREQLRQCGIGLILDFVPNHLAVDHNWVTQYPERFIKAGDLFAHGRNPLGAAWTDTLQLDYRRGDTRRAMTDILLDIAKRCDGVRCDMAMLVTHDIFLNTWGGSFDQPGPEFWETAINEVKQAFPGFLMLAEVYWNMEYRLKQLGFDYTYDKVLFDRLLNGDIPGLHEHLRGSSIGFQSHSIHFIENHDEQRSLNGFGSIARCKTAAVLTLTLPGARLVHEGQMEGRRKKLPVQIGRLPEETPVPELAAFYKSVLTVLNPLIFHEGNWHLLDIHESWEGNFTYGNFLAYLWIFDHENQPEYRIVVINLASYQSQCYVAINFPEIKGYFWRFEDLLNEISYVRDGDKLFEHGLFVNVPGNAFHLFNVRRDRKKDESGITLQSTLRGHNSGIYSMDWSPNGKILAAAGQEKTILLWNSEKGNYLYQIGNHQDVICSIAWAPNSKMIASGSDDKTVRIWNVESNELYRLFDGHYDSVLCIAWSPNGKLLASGSKDWLVHIWDVESSQKCNTLRGHADSINCVAWSPDGKCLASGSGDKTIRLWSIPSGKLLTELKGRDWISSIAWSPDGKLIASATGSGAIDIWDVEGGWLKAICHGHTLRVLCVVFSADGRLLASKSADGTVRIWQCQNWIELATIEEDGKYVTGVAFHPHQGEPLLATRDDQNNVIHIWAIDPEQLLKVTSTTPQVHYINAKVVLVGDSSVGKSSLGIRLAKKRFESVESTHGAQYWQIPVPEEILRQMKLPNVRAELTLWDLAGQPEYRLVHQLFLDDTDIALLLFDCSDTHDPFGSVPYWAKVLLKRAARCRLRVLVSARCDVSPVTVAPQEINDILVKYKLDQHFSTSAKTGDGVEDLFHFILGHIDWERLPRASTPRLFQVVREFLLGRKEKAKEVLIPIERIQQEVRSRYTERQVTQAEIDQGIMLLQTQGLVYRIDSQQDHVLILMKPELINQYASSIIQAARNHPMGIGAVPERDVLIGNLPFCQFERLSHEYERIVLEVTTDLLIKSELCNREMGWLIFPSQINVTRPRPAETHPRTEVAYHFSGSIETIYASLVVRLSYTDYFHREDQWKYAVEFSRNGYRLGFTMKQVEEGTGKLEMYFESGITVPDRITFIRFVIDHLRTKGINIEEEIQLYCPKCGREITNREAVEERIKSGQLDIPCQYCGASVLIPHGIEERYWGDQKLVEKQRQLAQTVKDRTEQEAKGFREDQQLYTQETDSRIHILHLADIHLGNKDDAQKYRIQLETDLRKELKVQRLEYLVISGDIGSFSTEKEYEAASEMMEALIQRTGLDTGRVLIVPGNHDLNWDLSKKAYPFVYKDDSLGPLPEGTFIPAGDTGALVRDTGLYQKRFAHFNNYFYKKIYPGEEYSNDYEKQFTLIKRSEDKILFLGLNSSWEIDHHFRHRPGINMKALTFALDQLLDDQYNDWLKIAVFHHPVSGKAMMNDEFLQLLAVHGFQICLHGHIHEAQEGFYKYDSKRGLHIIGAGTFGAPANEQVSGIPLQYNLMTLNWETHSITVETRRKEKPDGAWNADARWGDRNAPSPRFTFTV